MQHFHTRLKRLRKSRGLKQYQLADMLNIHRTTYTKYEIGGAEPSLETLCGICRALHISSDVLLGLVEEEPIVCDELSSFL